MTTRAQISEAADHEGGHTQLMRAALQGQTKTVKTLLESAADVNARDDGGRTALMFAVANMRTDSAKALVQHGADVNATASDGLTALILATLFGDSEIIQDLLSKGADVSGKFTQTGMTALMLARAKDYGKVVQLLEAAEAKQ